MSSFVASNQTELYQAITDAQASPDAASIITLTSSFQITSPPPAIAGKAITITTGANTLSYSSAAVFNIASGASLQISGRIQGIGGLNSGAFGKLGGGELNINGATGAGITKIGLNEGHTLITGGSEITFGTSASGAISQLDIASDPGQVASLTVSGEGTKLVATGTDPTDLSNGTAAQSSLTIEDGVAYIALTSGIRVHTPSSGGLATINVVGGSTLNVLSFGSFGGTTYVSVLDGAVIYISGNSSFRRRWKRCKCRWKCHRRCVRLRIEMGHGHDV